ncbi:hypothetical protein NE237_023643 [Protea cynaroides]|uniref:Uncharacterized protein n=1 Tax=Protea cynaroides TaxID=273540 RepID=A0A9Q0HD86_9MAGN|nr:hypothetical protein NE237_023643 [Protea cynaroides]
MPNISNRFLRISYVVFAFCSALFLGFFKGLLVGPIAGLILIFGNVGVILGLFPAHVYWTVDTIIKTNRFDVALKIAFLLALPALFALWLGLGIAGSIIVGVCYGFFTPWVSTFEAFRQETESKKFFHCIVDGTWGTIKGSCTVVCDFKDVCYHSYPAYLKEIQEGNGSSDQPKTLRFVHVPACIIVGLMGLMVDVPLYTAIGIIKSPLMLFKGWQRLLHDLVAREGPFFETACIPLAGLTIILWPLIVIGSVILAIFSSIFIGLYGSAIVYQERSFRRGAAYVIAMVAEFDEYTNDWLYLREGTILPKPQYRKKRVPQSTEFSVGGRSKFGLVPTDPPAILPSLAPSRSVRQAIQEVKMVQIWSNIMKSFEIKGKELLNANVITMADLDQWLKTKNSNEAPIISIGLPTYSMLHFLLSSIRSGSSGLILFDGVEITHMNRPQDRLLDWFFQPLMVLRDQIKVLNLEVGEVRFLEKVVLFGSNTKRMEAWENGSVVPQDSLRAAQIQGISRRLMGIASAVSKFPTYRRKFHLVIKSLISHSLGEGTSRSSSNKSGALIEAV